MPPLKASLSSGVLRHLSFGVLFLLLIGCLLGGSHALLLRLGRRRRSSLGGSSGSRGGAGGGGFQVEVHFGGGAAVGTDALDLIDILAVDFDGDSEGTGDAQPALKVMTLLVRLELVAALDVGLVNLDDGGDDGLAVFALDVAFDGRSLRENRRHGQCGEQKGNREDAYQLTGHSFDKG